MRTQIEGDWLDPVSAPGSGTSHQDARRNLATETLRLRSAARLRPARSPPPARHAPAPLPAVSVATAPAAKGRPLPVLAEGCDRGSLSLAGLEVRSRPPARPARRAFSGVGPTPEPRLVFPVAPPQGILITGPAPSRSSAQGVPFPGHWVVLSVTPCSVSVLQL